MGELDMPGASAPISAEFDALGMAKNNWAFNNGGVNRFAQQHGGNQLPAQNPQLATQQQVQLAALTLQNPYLNPLGNNLTQNST